ncbi:MAG: hypothetical protein RSB69_11915 [Odoribacter sp.]
MDGWILMHKKMLQWQWFQSADTLQLFLYCLLRANFEPVKWQGVDIQRGQFITSLPTIKQETGLTIQKIRTSIKRLKSTGEITNETTNKFRLITVCKYDSYQDLNEPRKQTDQQAIQQTTNRQLTSDKQYKEYKEISNVRFDDEFDVFWELYEKKRNREKCLKLWKNLSEKERTEIIDYIPKYKKAQPDKQFRKDPVTFLNQKSWHDELIFSNEKEKDNEPYRI